MFVVKCRVNMHVPRYVWLCVRAPKQGCRDKPSGEVIRQGQPWVQICDWMGMRGWGATVKDDEDPSSVLPSPPLLQTLGP